MSNVDGTSADKELFLLKVPQDVAEKWKSVLRNAVTDSERDEGQPSSSGAQADVLGWITLDEHRQQHLELSGVTCDGERLPKRYKLMEKGQIMPQSHVLLQKGSEYKCEGRISQLLTAQPNLEQGQPDKRYMALTGERDKRANTASAEIRLNTDKVRIASLASARLTTAVAQRRREKRSLTKEEFQEQKKDIEAEIFKLFERVPYWTLAKLMKETGLAPLYLKEVLQEIAILNKRGPYKDNWTIKKEFLENPDAMEVDAAPAAEAAAGTAARAAAGATTGT